MSSVASVLYRNVLKSARRIDRLHGGFVAGDGAALIASACRREAAETRLGALLATAQTDNAGANAGTATASLLKLASYYTKGGDESGDVAEAVAPSASVTDLSLSALVTRAFRAPVDDAARSDVGSRLDAAFASMRDASFVERAARCSAELDAIFARDDAAYSATKDAAWSARSLESMENAAIAIAELASTSEQRGGGDSAASRTRAALDRLARLAEDSLESAGGDGTLGAALAPAECDFDRFRVINRVLWEREGMRGATESEYSDPRSSHIDAVLRLRRGIPLALSLVFGAVARRAGLVSLAGTSFPAHFLLHARLRLPPRNAPAAEADAVALGVFSASFPGHGTELLRVSALALPAAEDEAGAAAQLSSRDAQREVREAKAAAVAAALADDAGEGSDANAGADANGAVILLVGTKITGDVNVPAGELSWACAVPAPSIAAARARILTGECFKTTVTTFHANPSHFCISLLLSLIANHCRIAPRAARRRRRRRRRQRRRVRRCRARRRCGRTRRVSVGVGVGRGGTQGRDSSREPRFS